MLRNIKSESLLNNINVFVCCFCVGLGLFLLLLLCHYCAYMDILIIIYGVPFSAFLHLFHKDSKHSLLEISGKKEEKHLLAGTC